MGADVVLVGAFERTGDAVVVMRALRVSGISPRKMGLAQRAGEVLQTSGLLAAVDAPEHDLAGALIGLGVPVRSARHYSSALERGCAIVTAQPRRDQLREATVSFESGGPSSLCLCRPAVQSVQT